MRGPGPDGTASTVSQQALCHNLPASIAAQSLGFERSKTWFGCD